MVNFLLSAACMLVVNAVPEAIAAPPAKGKMPTAKAQSDGLVLQTDISFASLLDHDDCVEESPFQFISYNNKPSGVTANKLDSLALLEKPERMDKGSVRNAGTASLTGKASLPPVVENATAASAPEKSNAANEDKTAVAKSGGKAPAVTAASTGLRAAPEAAIQTPLAYAPVSSAPLWEISLADKTLNSALARWTTQAGWQLLWELPVDYSVEANTTLTGSFEQAVEKVAKSMESAEIPMKAIFYKGNKVLRITAKGAQ